VRDVLEAQSDPPPVLLNLDTGDRMNLLTGSGIKNAFTDSQRRSCERTIFRVGGTIKTEVKLALGTEPKTLISDELSGFSQACQQEVEVHQSSIRLPTTNRTLHSGIIIEWFVAA
jgi:hypothetical protein